MSLPKLPLRIEDRSCAPFLSIFDADDEVIDSVRSYTSDDWTIPDARQAAERRLAELTALIEAETPKCPIRKLDNFDRGRPWGVVDAHGLPRWFTTEAERDAVYDALVALWHKEHGQ